MRGLKRAARRAETGRLISLRCYTVASFHPHEYVQHTFKPIEMCSNYVHFGCFVVFGFPFSRDYKKNTRKCPQRWLQDGSALSPSHAFRLFHSFFDFTFFNGTRKKVYVLSIVLWGSREIVSKGYRHKEIWHLSSVITNNSSVCLRELCVFIHKHHLTGHARADDVS